MASLTRALKNSSAFMNLLNFAGRRRLKRAMRLEQPALLTTPKTFYAIERRLVDYLEHKPVWGFDETTPARYREAFDLLREAYVWLRQHSPMGDALHFNRQLNTLEKMAKCEEVLSYPVRAYFELTSQCNLRCKMCGQSFYKNQPYTMPRSGMEQFTEQFKWFDEVSIFGFGESLLVDYVGELLDRFPPHTRSRLATNGILLTPANNRMLVDHGLKALCISLDATDPETYRQIRGVDKLETIKNNIRDLVQVMREKNSPYPRISLNFVAMRRNIEQLPGFVRLAKELGVQDVVADYLTVFSENMRDQSLFYDQELADRCVDQARAVAAEIGINLAAPIKFSDRQEPPARRPRCYEPWEFILIRGDGYIQACCTNNEVMAEWRKEGDFGRLWNSPEYRRMRRTLETREQSPACNGCYHVCFRDNRKEASHISILAESREG